MIVGAFGVAVGGRMSWKAASQRRETTRTEGLKLMLVASMVRTLADNILSGLQTWMDVDERLRRIQDYAASNQASRLRSR